MKEFRAVPGRAALITITIGIIAVMVTFLSALAAELSAQSVSTPDEVYGKNDAIVTSEGATSLSSSSMGETVHKNIQAWASDHNATTRNVYVNHARVDETPVTVISDFSLSNNQVAVTDDVNETAAAEGDSLTLSDAVGEHGAAVARMVGDKWLNHQAVIYAGCGVMEDLMSGQMVPAVMAVDESAAQPPNVTEGTIMRDGKRNNLSASYQGERTSLNAITSMLHVISALIVGAFFAVWTVQRLHGVTISSALGASRSILVADSLAQVLAMLAIGVDGDVVMTATAGWTLQSDDVMPIVVDASMAVTPGLILTVTGVVDALLALAPVFCANPTTALANA